MRCPRAGRVQLGLPFTQAQAEPEAECGAHSQWRTEAPQASGQVSGWTLRACQSPRRRRCQTVGQVAEVLSIFLLSVVEVLEAVDALSPLAVKKVHSNARPWKLGWNRSSAAEQARHAFQLAGSMAL